MQNIGCTVGSHVVSLGYIRNLIPNLEVKVSKKIHDPHVMRTVLNFEIYFKI